MALAVSTISVTMAIPRNSVHEGHPLALQTRLQSSKCPHSSHQTATSAAPSWGPGPPPPPPPLLCPVFLNIFTRRSCPRGPDRVFVTCHAQRCRATASAMTVDLVVDLLKSIRHPAVVFALKLNNYKFIPWKTPWERAVQRHFGAAEESTFT